jgi:hypothetical protein
MISRLGSALKCYQCADGDDVCKRHRQVADCGEVPQELKLKNARMVCMNGAIMKEDGELGIFRGCAPLCELKSLEVVLFSFFFQIP